MKTRTRARIYVSIAAMMVTAALAAPAAGQQVPFKGAFDGYDALFPGPSATSVLLVTTATGTGTRLGRFTLTQELTLEAGSLTPTGSARWTAANGDIVDTTVAASAIPGSVVFTVTEIHTITGGTGRFSGAGGSFTVHRTHVVATSEDGTHVTFGWFEGTITSTGAAR